MPIGFNGSFALEDAAFVMAPLVGFGQADYCLTSLLDKSFMVANFEEQTFRYRLLDTTRAYAQEKLVESGEANPAADVTPSTSGSFSTGSRRMRPASNRTGFNL